MGKIVNPAYLRFGFTLGFGLGSILLYRYYWHGLIGGDYAHNLIAIVSSIVVGLIGALICLGIFHGLAPEYSPYSNFDALILELWHSIAYSVIFWSVASVIHFMGSFETGTVINNPDFPKENVGLLMVSSGIAMGISFSFTKLIGGVLKSKGFSLLGPFLVGGIIGGIQGFLLGNDIVGIPESVILRSETTRIVIGSILGFIFTPIIIMTAIYAKNKDTHDVFNLWQRR